jgi:type VI protein secretion system component Hcp
MIRNVFPGALLGLTSALAATPARADYIGPSYLEVPGVRGDASATPFRGWLRAEAHYWGERPARKAIRGISGKESGLIFTFSNAPREGASVLSLAIDKRSPALPGLMALCRAGQAVPQVQFAEVAEFARHPQEHGPRPADVPADYRYVLKDATLSCPEVAAATEQAIAIAFKAIEWRNVRPQQPDPRPITAQPASLPRGARGGANRTFVISWFAPVADASENQCPAMNRKPTQDEYFALMPPERASRQRAALAGSGGANTTVLPYRGPDEMNVILLPGIVGDPGHVLPVADVVRGFDLDGRDGGGLHRDFVSPDGRRGIDNQLFTLLGCVEGWRRRGFLPMIGNELRRAGGLSILVDISGIDDPRNDDEVFVTLLYSADPMKRDGTSKIVLPDFTFRPNPNPEFSQDFARFRGRMVDGAVMTDALPLVTLHEGPTSTWPLFDARMRVELLADGTMKATLGGYRDWRELLAMAFFQASDYENTIGFNAPAMYNAARRAADGLPDAETGRLNGLSAAYEMEGVPAFITPEDSARLARGGRFGPDGARR